MPPKKRKVIVEEESEEEDEEIDEEIVDEEVDEPIAEPVSAMEVSLFSPSTFILL